MNERTTVRAGTLRRYLGATIPQWFVRRAVDVSVRTDRDRFTVDESVVVTVEFHNRLPVPVSLRTPRQRLWTWSVDGEVAASDERRYLPDRPATLSFQASERKTVTREWDGRFTRTRDEGITERVPAEPGEHTIAASVAVDGPPRPADETTVIVEP